MRRSRPRILLVSSCQYCAAPKTHVGKSYELHGSKEISQVQLAHAVSEALGVPVRYQPLPIEEYRLQLETIGFPELYVDFFVALAHDARDGIFSGWNDVYSQVTGNQPARRPGLHQVTPLSIRCLMNRNQQMLNTYKAVQITRPGILEIVARPLTDPGEGQVRIRVEACGICQSDSLAVEGLFPTTYPRVPGHEVVGKIDAIGRGVRNWRIGERVLVMTAATQKS